MTDITMPSLSDSMEQGTVLKWLVEEGQAIALGEDLIEIETDKATMTYAAEAEGVLRILVAEGETVPVGAVIARVGAEEPGGAHLAPAQALAHAGHTTPNGSTSDGLASSGVTSDGITGRPPDGSPKPTPLARRIASAHGVALHSLAGSGPRGRVVKADVIAAAGLTSQAAREYEGATATARTVTSDASSFATRAEPGVARGSTAPPHSTQPRSTEGSKGESKLEAPTRLQALVARRMAEVKATVPEFQVQAEVRMDAAVALRSNLKQLSGDHDVIPSINDIVVRACAVALLKHPRANASFTTEGFLIHPRVNIGVAVASQDALVVPTVFDADEKSLRQIARETRRLADRVRSGEISPSELSGGTFTVSNLGMYGMTAITPVINLHQAAILGVGSLRTVLARVKGEIEDITLMTLTLSCDHRILYGSDAASLLADVKALLEQPLKLAL